MRTAGTPEAPLFCAADVCAALGLDNVSQACSRVKESQQTRITSNDAGGIPLTYVYVTEPGLYKLINASRKPDAERFQDWIAEEVLPSIRKTGAYAMQALSPAQQLLATAQALVALEQEQASQAGRIAQLEAADSAVADRVAQLEAHVQPDPEYYTILAWSRRIGAALPLRASAEYGRRCSALSRSRGYRIGAAPDMRFGTVGAYHVDVLREVVGDDRRPTR